MDLTTLSILDLLKLHSAATEALKDRGVLRTRNNPVGDYVEWLVSTALDLKLTSNSAAGHDAVAADGRKIQIKGRRISETNASRQLGVIRNLEKVDFDDLIAVILDESYEVLAAYLIPHRVIAEYASHRAHVNGYVLHVRGKLLLDSRVTDITSELKKQSARNSGGSSAITNISME